jgi:hypothetical protein
MSKQNNEPPALGVALGSAPTWRMKMHTSGATMSSLYRDDKLGVQMERWCKRRPGNGPMGYTYTGGGVAYYIDGDKTEYKTEAAMMAALALKPNNKVSHAHPEKGQ